MHNKNATTLNPYIMFNGNCREAMAFYADCLNGDLQIIPYEGSPMQVSDADKDKVMHANLKFGDGVIMAADNIQGSPSENGTSIHLSIACNDLAEASKIFENLSRDGKVTFPFDKTFWGATFGMLKDKYGLHWMVNCETE